MLIDSVEPEVLQRVQQRVLTGAGLGWIILPIVVVIDGATRDYAGAESAVAVLVDAIAGASAGLLIGAYRLGLPGLTGAFGGALVGAVLPYLAIPALLGVTGPNIEGYAKYAPGMLAAAVSAGVAMGMAARSRVRFRVRPVATVVAGLVVLALWFAFWTAWAQAVRQT